MDRYEMRLSGSGGQGLILAGKIMAEAAVIYDGRNAVQTQSYGPEARGGASKAEVVISDGDIDYPKALNLDLLLALTQVSCAKYSKDLKEGGILIVDSGLVSELPPGNFRVYRAPITEIAVKKIGKAVMDLENAPYGGWRFPVEVRLAGYVFIRFAIDVAAGLLYALADVRVEGDLTDYYDPREKAIHLSRTSTQPSVYSHP